MLKNRPYKDWKIKKDDLAKKVAKALNLGRHRKKAAGNARGDGFEIRPLMRRTLPYAATTRDEAQRNIRTFYEASRNSAI
jgi:hypothetical protein